MKKLILIIEDDTYIMDSMKLLLEQEGFDFVCARNGQEGIDLLDSAQRLPDVILLDLMMPVKDGFEFRAEQLENPKLSEIPVIILTAEGSLTKKKEKLRANAFIKKPFNIDQLIEAIHNLDSGRSS